MKTKAHILHQSGRSIVELMVAIAIGLAISAAIAGVYISSLQTSRVQDASAQIADSGRYALLLLGKQLRQAGYTTMAYYREISPTEGNRPGRWIKKPEPSFQGLFGCTGGFKNAASAFATFPEKNPECVGDAAAPDAFLVRYSLDIKEDITSLTRTVDYDAKKGTGVDCLGNQVTATTSNPLLTVENRYFIKTNPATNLQELYCLGSGSTASGAQPIVEGVEDMVIRYGLDRQGIPSVQRDMASDAFVSADAVQELEWQYENTTAGALVPRSRRVLAVEMCLLMRSAARGQAGNQTYKDCRGNTKTSTDGFFRQPFRSTFLLRNHVGDPA
jgi:type IV pilus assembly protein PilW